MTQRYFGSFCDFDDMLMQWGAIDKNEIVPASDDEVIFASYGTENWSGEAIVIFHKAGKLYEVNGGHCSCYGLSESNISGNTTSQWSAEETSRAALAKRSLDFNLDEGDAEATAAWKIMLEGLPD